jgi:hypothetical protein
MLRTGHTPLSLHYFRGATQLANPYIRGALLTEPLSHGALLQQASYFITVGYLLRALFFPLLYCGYSLWGPLPEASLYKHTPYITAFSTSLH